MGETAVPDGHSRQSRDAIRLWRASRAATRGKDRTPLNNNRGNNRRRGRGSNRQQGGQQQLNRIDSRARGNAPQMLEKYRKLAHDAHLNGDRVTAEYYLQFADHYFRVIADTRQRQEEQRARREDGGQDRQDHDREDNDEGSEFSADSDFPSYDQPRQNARRERDDRDNRGERNDRPDRRRQYEREERQAAPEAAEEGEAGDESADNPYEPPENPFVRPTRNSSRGLRPRRERQTAPSEDEAQGGEPGFDPSSLPPSISARAASRLTRAIPKLSPRSADPTGTGAGLRG
jgi:hypothetical protein